MPAQRLDVTNSKIPEDLQVNRSFRNTVEWIIAMDINIHISVWILIDIYRPKFNAQYDYFLPHNSGAANSSP